MTIIGFIEVTLQGVDPMAVMCDDLIMTLPIAIRVPQADRHDLEALLRSQGEDVESISVSRPFDGESVVQAVVILSGVSYPFFRTWLNSRAASRKSFSIVRNGTEISGYTSTEAAKIIKELDAELGHLPDEIED